MHANARPINRRSPEQFRDWLRANGITLTAWCREHDIDRMTATDLLRGRRVGHYGEAHKAAVAMGIKPDPKELGL